jgi:hypothetical protein
MHPAYPRVPPVPPVPRVPQVALACVRACRSADWLSAFACKNRFEPLLCADPNQPVSVAAGRCTRERSCGNGVRYHGTYVDRSCDAGRSNDAAAQVRVRQQAVAPFAAPAQIAPAACCRRCRYSPKQRREQVAACVLFPARSRSASSALLDRPMLRSANVHSARWSGQP